jgi:hypothetical protein
MKRINASNASEHISGLIAKRRKILFSISTYDLLTKKETQDFNRAQALTRRIDKFSRLYPPHVPDYTPRVPNNPMIPAPLPCVVNGVTLEYAPYDIIARWEFTAGLYKFYRVRHNHKRQAKMIAYRNLARKALQS